MNDDGGRPTRPEYVRVTGDRRDEWPRVENAPLYHLTSPKSPPDDELITRRPQSRLER